MELRTSSNLRANGGMKNDIIVTDGIKNKLRPGKNSNIVTDGIKNELRPAMRANGGGRTTSLSLMESRTH